MTARKKVKFRIIRKPFLEWSDDTLFKLTRLTLSGHGSGLREVIEEKPQRLMTWVAFADGEPVGWGIHIIRERDHRQESMFYVKLGWRRRGIGTRILKRMRKDGYPFWVHIWNTESSCFFTKMKWVRDR